MVAGNRCARVKVKASYLDLLTKGNNIILDQK